MGPLPLCTASGMREQVLSVKAMRTAIDERWAEAGPYRDPCRAPPGRVSGPGELGRTALLTPPAGTQSGLAKEVTK
jgi:hypothetical protein